MTTKPAAEPKIRVNLFYGVMHDSLSKQLKKQKFKFDQKRIIFFEKQRESINIIRIAGLLTDAQSNKIYHKFHRSIITHLQQHNGK